MRVDVFDYKLPQERIAQRPPSDRAGGRLLNLLDPSSATDAWVRDLPSLMPKGALIVANDTKVLPARLLGTKAKTGGRAEIFLVRPREHHPLTMAGEASHSIEVWQALGHASKGLPVGCEINVGALTVRVLGRDPVAGLLDVALSTSQGHSIAEAVREVGRMPLPPYIRRPSDIDDAERYQTTFARPLGAVAAPTAGLHLTEELVQSMVTRGCEFMTLTLHVGIDTFRPVSVTDLDDHPMHTEHFEVTTAVADAIDRARGRNAPVVAIGTTVVRALESAADPNRPGRVMPTAGKTALLIQPGFKFKVVDTLLTNFHMPRSTLLALVCAFGGIERIHSAYRTALEREYRFCSYGDAMLLHRSTAVVP